jgi:hypothetical protein
MSEISNEQPAALVQRPVSVDQLHEQLRLTRDRLRETAHMVGELETWCADVPRRHRPDGEEVLVTDLVQASVSDPAELQRQISSIVDLAARLRAEVDRAQVVVRKQTDPFAPPGGRFRTPDGGEVAIEARLGTARFADGERFEQQRAAVRGVLSYTAPDQTWRGRLPAVIGAADGAWEAVVAAARAGAEVIVRP